MERGKFLTKNELIEANRAAIREKRNRALQENFVMQLPDDVRFPISLSFYHNTVDEIRVKIIFDEKGTSGFLDMSALRYNTLSSFHAGVVKPGVKRPYKDGREWKETVVRKPVRDSGFRPMILSAYNGQCAVCTVNDPTLLRAAHIVPVEAGGEDSVNNGLCLCVLHDIAYEKGILQITPEYDVVVSSENELNVEFMNLRLPENKVYHPLPKNLLIKMELVQGQIKNADQ